MKKLTLLLFPTLIFCQVGINNKAPQATLHISKNPLIETDKGNIKLDEVETGSVSDSILVWSNKIVKRVSSADFLASSSKCPMFIKSQSNPYYLLFNSSSSIPNPNNPLTIQGFNFVSAETSIRNNVYIYAYTNRSGQPLNINQLSVNFGGKNCNY